LKNTVLEHRFTAYVVIQTLREAKTVAESREQEEEAFLESRKSNFGAQFDDFQGTPYFTLVSQLILLTACKRDVL